MGKLPLFYEVNLGRAESTSPYPLSIVAGARPKLSVGPPSDFGGDDVTWNPEHLLVSATASCFAATFFAQAKRANLKVGAFSIRGTGILDHGLSPKGTVGFTSIELHVDVTVTSDDIAAVRHLLDETKRSCFVANSLRCNVELVAEVRAS